jgi:hypothetical protein
MPYRNDRDARDAKREARARREERKPAPSRLQLSRGSIAALALGALSVLVMAAGLASAPEPTRTVGPPTRPEPHASQAAPLGALGGLAGLAGTSEGSVRSESFSGVAPMPAMLGGAAAAAPGPQAR